jgi:hypothetical protein
MLESKAIQHQYLYPLKDGYIDNSDNHGGSWTPKVQATNKAWDKWMSIETQELQLQTSEHY